MTIVTRFPPSPTGLMHIGTARTLLYNWLFARKHGGKVVFRIEDTDRERYDPAHVQALVNGVKWIGLDYDGEIVSQFERRDRHAEVAQELLKAGKAYYCYCSPEELDAMREKAKAEGKPTFYDRRWRDSKETPPAGVKPVIRIKAPIDGATTVPDHVQGDVTVNNEQLDDMIILRSDGTPVYMLAVVVDDHDMGVTHVIRGDDHLTNAARQIVIYRAADWTPPLFAHVPLIHGEDGKKLSKRHGAQAVHEWRDMGYLPEAMNAYLMRLGWSPGHDNILTKEDAIPQFEIAQIGKAPARLDFKKLDSVNAHFLSLADDARVTRLVEQHMKARGDAPLSDDSAVALARATPVLKKRAKTIPELAEQARFVLVKRPLTLDDTAKKLLNDDFKPRLSRLRAALENEPTWDHVSLGSALKAFATSEGVGLGQIGPGLRAALTGGTPSPDLGQTLELLGRDEALARIADQV